MKYLSLMIALFILISTGMSRVAVASSCGKGIVSKNSAAGMYLEMFPTCKKMQLNTLGKYHHALKTQMSRLLRGLQEGTTSSISKEELKVLENYLIETSFESAYIRALYQQLEKFEIEKECRPFHYTQVELYDSTLATSIDKAKEYANKQGYLYGLSKGYAQSVTEGSVKTATKTFLKQALKGIKRNAIRRIVLSGLGSVTRQSFSKVVGGLVVGSAQGIGVGALTDLLKGSVISDVSKWKSYVKKSPVLLLNPEWMEQLPTNSFDPWFTHCLAYKNAPKMYSNALEHLLYSSEVNFLDRVDSILSSDENLQSRLEGQCVMPSDNTRVHTGLIHAKIRPSWTVE